MSEHSPGREAPVDDHQRIAHAVQAHPRESRRFHDIDDIGGRSRRTRWRSTAIAGTCGRGHAIEKPSEIS